RAAEITVRDRGAHGCDASDLASEVARHAVDVVGKALPDAADALHLGLTAEVAFGAHLAGDTRDLVAERIELVDHRVDGVFELEDLSSHIDGDHLREVPLLNPGLVLGVAPGLAGQVAGHDVHARRPVVLDAADAPHLGLTTQAAFGAHLASDTRHLVGERVELVDHRVDRLLELEDLAPDVDRD